jgi:sugar phosphate isomerase/epimerase
MKPNKSKEEHLTYCTNIHPAESWGEVRENFDKYVLPIKNLFIPDQPFGVGLRLSAAAADELNSSEKLDEFRNFLSEHDLYIFTINGFPYGRFHEDSVKEKVYLPDWRSEERLRYTKVLSDLLAALLPSNSNLYGSISTVPGAFNAEIRTLADIERMGHLLVDATIHLMEIKAKRNKWVTLALEPEPCCYLETVEETISFFRDYLFSEPSIRRVATRMGLVPSEAEAAMRCHLGVCLDLCHAAVEYEDSYNCVKALRDADIQIFKMQISAGLQFSSMTLQNVEFLRQLDDNVYLHQVTEQAGSHLVRYTDLDKAIATLGQKDEGREWRIHFHVPIFLADLGEFHTTQEFIRKVLDLHRRTPVSLHLEVETYTWGVMPRHYQRGNVIYDVCRELEWVQKHLRS